MKLSGAMTQASVTPNLPEKTLERPPPWAQRTRDTIRDNQCIIIREMTMALGRQQPFVTPSHLIRIRCKEIKVVTVYQHWHLSLQDRVPETWRLLRRQKEGQQHLCTFE